MYEHFIKKKHAVREEGKSRTFSSGNGPVQKPRNVVLCGLKGSGRIALAHEAASRLGLEVVQPETDMDVLTELAQDEGRIIVIGPEHLALPEAMTLIPRIGHVFFLMADVPFLVESRQLGAGEDRDRLALEFPDMEMRFHALGGMPLSAYRPLDENAAQIAEVLEMGA